MIPYITKGDLTKLSPKKQKKICGCVTLCTDFYTFTTDDEDFTLCAGDTRQLAFEILEKQGLVTQKLAFPTSKWGWTTDQEEFVKKYLKDKNAYYNGKIKYGTYSLIGEMLGKTRDQVKNKIQHMQKEGKL
ncbi:hypothetical protein [Neobacillus massiliamazoniensis]|uniref:Uncharacterized protein n=1 Tax=Neobacillus massiliamazoniensis TaxID=1499688 RepID=A0A0U1NQL1_9BACI|nr:hypothetical protein [Neobacillus massiliamazoniensis]CRK80331.1 hypothetical protein BN000_00212 [Neobacillus massiliamazoniensis]